MMEERSTSTYIIDAEESAEIARVEQQARVVNASIGLFPERVKREISQDASILDIGCGTGTWVLDVAFEYQEAAVIGYDISPTLVQYAETKAIAQHLQNCSFEVMDVLKSLPEVRSLSFDVVSLRFCAGWVPKEKWLPLLKECARILKPGGFVVMTEGEWPYTTSKALNRFNLLISQALYKAGLGLSVDEHSQGVVARMGNFLDKSGLKAIDVEAYALNFSVNNPSAHRVQYDNFIVLYELVVPFLLKYSTATSEELTFLHAEFIREMWQEDFCGIGPLFRYFAQKEQKTPRQQETLACLLDGSDKE